MASRKGSSCGLSPACPSVSRIVSGRPRASAARSSLVVGPPRDRPSASPGQVSTAPGSGQVTSTGPRRPLFPARRPNAGDANAGGVHVHGPLHRHPVVVDLDVGQDPIPGAIDLPPAQPLVAGLPRPVSLGDVSPRRPGGQLPADAVEHLPVIMPSAVSPSRLRQHALNACPRLVGELMPPN